MNYYEHHLGDYAEATAHLSFVEDAAYSRLIRKYYASEKPIPAEIKAAQRLIGARTKEEKEAVETILEEFFELREDGWHNMRCDDEIARYQDKQAKAKRSAEARWNKQPTHSDGNANASPDAMRTHSEGSAPRARSSPQSPDTSHQTPESTQPSSLSEPVGGEPNVGGDDFRSIPSVPKMPGQWMVWFNQTQGTDYSPSSRFDRSNVWQTFTRWCEQGVTTDEVSNGIRKALAEAKGPISNLPSYVEKVLISEAQIAVAPQKLTQHQLNQQAIAASIFGPQSGAVVPSEKLIEGEVIHGN